LKAQKKVEVEATHSSGHISTKPNPTAGHPALIKGGQRLWPFGQQHHHQRSQAKERRQNVEVPGVALGLAEPIFGSKKMVEFIGSKKMSCQCHNGYVKSLLMG